MEALLTMLLSEKMGVDMLGPPSGERSADAEAVRKRIRDGMQGTDSASS